MDSEYILIESPIQQVGSISTGELFKCSSCNISLGVNIYRSPNGLTKQYVFIPSVFCSECCNHMCTKCWNILIPTLYEPYIDKFFELYEYINAYCKRNKCTYCIDLLESFCRDNNFDFNKIGWCDCQDNIK